jgi:trans-aconitate 2-methyltransferase
MPDNWQEPSHTLMRQVAQEMGFPESGRHPLPGAQAYYDILTACGCEVDIWRTTYYHPLESHQAIIDWLQSTGLRYLQPLDAGQQEGFLERYLALLQQHYPLQCNGKVAAVPTTVYRRAAQPRL